MYDANGFSRAAANVRDSNGVMAGVEREVRKTLEHGPNWHPGGGKADNYSGLFFGAEMGAGQRKRIACPKCGWGSYIYKPIEDRYSCKSCGHSWVKT